MSSCHDRYNAYEVALVGAELPFALEIANVAYPRDTGFAGDTVRQEWTLPTGHR